jgi:hypothetical protein
MRGGRVRSWQARIRATILLSVWALALVLAVRDVLSRLSVPSWGNPRGEARSAELNEINKIGQTFVAPLPGLAGVQVTLDSTASRVVRHVTMRLSEAGEAGKELGAKVFEIPSEALETDVRLDLAPVSDSKGKTFYISLETDAPPGQGATVACSPVTAIEGARTYLNNQTLGGALQFQTYYSLRTRDKIDLVLTNLVKGRNHLLGSKGFYVGVGLVYACVLGLFVWQIAHTVQDGRQDRP